MPATDCVLQTANSIFSLPLSPSKATRTMKIILYSLISFIILLSACQSKEKPAGEEKSGNKSGELTVKPVTDTSVQGDKATDLFNKGVNLFKEEKYEESLTYFDRVLQIRPKDYKALYNKGLGYLKLKDYDQAIVQFDKAIAINPKDSASFLNKGMAMYFQGKYQEAVKEYSEAIRIRPSYGFAFYNRGIAKGQLKDYAGAIADFDKALEYKRNYPEALYNRGLANFLKGDAVKACEDWKKAKEVGSVSADQALKLYCK